MKRWLTMAALALGTMITVGGAANADVPPPDTTDSDTTADTVTPVDTAPTDTAPPAAGSDDDDDCAAGGGRGLGFGLVAVLAARTARRRDRPSA